MSYLLKQIVQLDDIDDSYMTLVEGDSIADRITEPTDVMYGNFSGGLTFQDECLRFDNVGNFSNEEYYYLHCKIKRLTSPQTFYVKLISQPNEGRLEPDHSEQYIRTITVNPIKGEYNQGDPYKEEDVYMDVELIFNPFRNAFDTILFELQREIGLDTLINPRYATIGYEELSIINNKLPDNKEFVKMGIQTRPSTLMCLNGEEIRVLKNGIQELKDGTIPITFFSIANPAQEKQEDENPTALKEQMDSCIYQDATEETNLSESFTNPNNYSKIRYIKSFVLDYIERN